jgi:hypothetical protein
MENKEQRLKCFHFEDMEDLDQVVDEYVRGMEEDDEVDQFHEYSKMITSDKKGKKLLRDQGIQSMEQQCQLYETVSAGIQRQKCKCSDKSS